MEKKINSQQPQRSNSSIQGRAKGYLGGNSVSGHTTPISGMFQTGGVNYGQMQQPQLPPNRNAQLSVGGPALANSNRPNIFGGQRPYVERRAMQGSFGGGPMSNMGNFRHVGRGGYDTNSGGPLNSFHNVFGGGDTKTPAFNDPSEFPSLSNARGHDQTLPQLNILQPPESKPYGNLITSFGMGKQPEFTMLNEDFPALSGSSHSDDAANASGITEINLDGTENSINSIVGGNSGLGAVGSSGSCGNGSGGGNTAGIDGLNEHQGEKPKLIKNDVQTLPDGKVTNIPASMLNDQYGMIGLLTLIRAAESDPNLTSLALGIDLTSLGLNLNSHESLLPTFAGPFADQPCRAQDVEYNVPSEYLVNFSIRDKLPSPRLNKLPEDLLFYLFYTNIGDIMQLMAAVELYNRGWRYHMEEKIWISRIPGPSQYEKIGTKERGTFYYFDAHNWKRLSKVFLIDPEKLYKCPNINTFMNNNGQSV